MNSSGEIESSTNSKGFLSAITRARHLALWGSGINSIERSLDSVDLM